MTTTVIAKPAAFSLPTNLASVEGFIGALYGYAIGSATMTQVNADIVSYGGLNNTLNAYYSAGFGSQTTAAVAASVVANLGVVAGQNGLVAADVTQAVAYVTGVLNAAPANARGAAILNVVSLYNGLAGTTGPLANFSAAATSWTNTQSSAVQYAGTSTSDAALSSAVTTVAAANAAAAAAALIGKTFTLTSGTDSFSGSSALDTFVATNTSTAAVFTAGDSLIGGGGNDVFSVSQASGTWSQPTGITVSGIPTVNATLVGGGSISTASGSGFVGVTALNVNSSAGTVSATGDSTTAIALTTTPTTGNTTAVQGGSNDSVTLTNAITGNSVTVGSSAAPVGTVAITVNDQLAITANVTAATAITNATSNPGGAIAVTGGTAITVTQNVATDPTTASAALTSSNYYDLSAGTVTVTGTAVTTQVTSTQTAPALHVIQISGSDNVSNAKNGIVGVLDNAVVITDATSTSTTAAGTIATVTLNGYGGSSSVTSNALTTLNLSNAATKANNLTAARLTLTNSLATGAPTALTINQGAGASGYLYDANNKITTLNVATTAATGTLTGFNGSNVNTLNVSGAGVLSVSSSITDASAAIAGVATNFTNSLMTQLTALTVTGAGGLSMDLSGNTSLTKVVMGNSGANTVTLGATQAYTGSTGADTVTISANPAVAINGNGGTNTIVLNSALGSYTAAGLANLTGFTILGTNTSTTGTLDVSRLPNAITLINVLGEAANTTASFTNVTAGTNLQVKNASVTTGGISIATSDYNGQNNSITLTIVPPTVSTTGSSGGASLGSTLGTLTLNDAIGGGLGTLNVTSSPTVQGAANTIATLNDTWLSNLNITGTAALNVTNVYAVDGSAGISSYTLNISDNDTSTATSTIATLKATNLANIAYSGSKAFQITAITSDATSGLSVSNTNTSTSGAGVFTIGSSTFASLTSLRLTNSVAITATVTNTAALTVLGSTDNATVSITHSVGTSGDTITIGNGGTGSSTTTTASSTNNTIVTGSGADTISVGSGSNTVTGGTGADIITFASHSTVDRIVLANSDSGAFTQPSGTNNVSTANFDIYTGLKAGDQIQLPAATAMNTSGIKVTNLTSSVYNGLAGNEYYIQGTYTSGTQSFVGSSTGTDTLLVLQTTGTTTNNEAIVLVGYVASTAAGYGSVSGIITLA